MGLVQHGTLQIPSPRDRVVQGRGCGAADGPSVGASRESSDGRISLHSHLTRLNLGTNLRGLQMSISPFLCAFRLFLARFQSFAVNARADCQSARCSVLKRYGQVTSQMEISGSPELCRIQPDCTCRLCPPQSSINNEIIKCLDGLKTLKFQ
jgi:hypothetical protein